MVKDVRGTALSGCWCGAYGQPYDWRKPNALPTLQIGDAANGQMAFLSYGAPDGEWDNMISALKLVRNSINGDKLGVVVNGLSESSKEQTCGGLGDVHFGGLCNSGGHHG